MKKIIVIMVMLFVLPAASCGRQEQQEVSGNNEEVAGYKELTAVDLEQDGVCVAEYIDEAVDDVIYFDESKLVYVVSGQHENPDLTFDRVYLYDKKMGKSKFLLDVKDVHCGKADICVLDNKVYYAYGHMTDGLEYNSLLEVDLDNSTAQLIPIDDAVIPFVDIAVTDEDVFILKRDESGSRSDYIVERLDGQEFTEIARTVYFVGEEAEDDEGEVILDIAGDGQYLYLYKEEASDKNDYFICMDRDGTVRESYPVELSEDMKLEVELAMEVEPEEEDLDSPWEIAKKGNYYIIQTLNSRNLIFDVKGKKAVKLGVPEQLGSRDLTYTSNLVENTSAGRYLYFQQVLENSVYVFDSKTGQFGHFDIEVNGEIWNMMTNDKNQFLFEVLRANDKTDYILYNENIELQ